MAISNSLPEGIGFRSPDGILKVWGQREVAGRNRESFVGHVNPSKSFVISAIEHP